MLQKRNVGNLRYLFFELKLDLLFLFLLLFYSLLVQRESVLFAVEIDLVRQEKNVKRVLIVQMISFSTLMVFNFHLFIPQLLFSLFEEQGGCFYAGTIFSDLDPFTPIALSEDYVLSPMGYLLSNFTKEECTREAVLRLSSI